MKKFLLISLLLMLGVALYSQDGEKVQKVASTYDRSSITLLFVDNDGENHWNRAKGKIAEMQYSDKYNNNNLESLLLKPLSSRGMLAYKQEDIGKALNSIEVGKQVVALWYNRKDDGTMDMDLVHARGRFTATDADFFQAQTSKRGNAALEEFGNRLIRQSYILVVDLSSIKTMEEAGRDKFRGWQSTLNTYLFQVDFTEEVKNEFYETWIYEDDSSEEIARKQKLFKEFSVPIKPVVQKTISLSASQPTGDSGLSLLYKPKTEDELLQELVQKSLDESIFRIEKDVEEFKVKTSLYETRPLRAKIGLKEGLKTDARFYVYEYVYDEKTNTSVPKRRGVIRAASKSKITDNRQEATGDMGSSEFYQVYGRRLEPGFLIQQQNDMGIEVSLGAELGEIGGFYGRVDYRLGKTMGVKSFFAYVEGGVEIAEYYTGSYYSSLTGSGSFLFLRYGGGLAKGMQLSTLFELRPYLGVGLESASQGDVDNDDAPSATYIKPGINLALNLNHNFQIVGGAGSYLFITNASSETYGAIGPWNEVFTDRSGLSVFLALRVGF